MFVIIHFWVVLLVWSIPENHLGVNYSDVTVGCGACLMKFPNNSRYWLTSVKCYYRILQHRHFNVRHIYCLQIIACQFLVYGWFDCCYCLVTFELGYRNKPNQTPLCLLCALLAVLAHFVPVKCILRCDDCGVLLGFIHFNYSSKEDCLKEYLNYANPF